MNCGMMFFHIVVVVLFAWGQVVSKLSSTFSVVEQTVIQFHVHCLQILDNIVVDDAKCSGAVRLHWGWRLGLAHEFEGMAGRNCFSAVDLEYPHLSLCCGGHDPLDNLCNCEDDTIVWWFGCAVGHGKMSAHPAACFLIWRGRMHCCALQVPCCLCGM
jgi:hypothetical protein